jgi:hypothetical protein
LNGPHWQRHADTELDKSLTRPGYQYFAAGERREQGMFDTEWLKAEKKVDPEYAGSIYEDMGMDNILCPTCGAHLKGGICLNTCHLSKASQERFAALWASMGRKP